MADPAIRLRRFWRVEMPCRQRMRHTPLGEITRPPQRSSELCEASQFRGDALWPEAWIAQGKGDDALLDPWGELVGHPRQSALTWPQCVLTELQDLRPPVVVRRAMHPKGAASLADPDPGSVGEKRNTEAEEYVIMDHGGGKLLLS